MATFERVPRWGWAAAGLVVAAGVGILVFEPHTLFIDARVDEAFPAPPAEGAVPAATVAPAPSPEAPAGSEPSPADAVDFAPTASPTAPTALVTGAFVDRDHPTSGTATIYAVPGNAPVLRFDELVTDNGPDLHVYLTSAEAGAPATAFDDDFTYVGPLKGNLGNQNYQLPVDVDLDVYRTVVIWCDRFDVAFGAADLV